jgi:gp178
MNKQELIEKFEEIGIHGLNMFGTVVKGIPTETAIDLIKQLDEPKPVKVPQCVADWYLLHYHDFNNSIVNLCIRLEDSIDNNDFLKWISNTKDFIKILVNIHQFGYEVEEEKRYYVRFKWIEDSYSYLALIKHLHAWTLKNITLDKKFRTAHTRKELEDAGFSWVFDCPGIEIEEVEE